MAKNDFTKLAHNVTNKAQENSYINSNISTLNKKKQIH
jgi:hypothetical protein